MGVTIPTRISRALLFDWGDTLMRVFPQFTGPMSRWSDVELMPYAVEALSTLHSTWTICLATNAADSDEADVRFALSRVDIDQYIDHVYCFKKVRVKKPHPDFFAFILKDLGMLPSQVVMVGDDYEADIQGATANGIQAIWVNPSPPFCHPQAQVHWIADLSLLPSLFTA